jgi:predicted amidohydrolase
VPVSNVTKNCLRMRGYEPTEDGLERAIAEGWSFVADGRGDEIALLRDEEARELWREFGTAVGISFPVNDPTSQFILATARHPDGRFVVDALSTDGGGIPRNVTVERGLAVVALGGLSLDDFVRKACLNPARMLGLDRKGHLGVGADADAALVDPSRRRVRATFAAGEPVMLDGVVVGSGGMVLTTARGERAVRAAGLEAEVVDLARSGLYRPQAMT